VITNINGNITLGRFKKIGEHENFGKILLLEDTNEIVIHPERVASISGMTQKRFIKWANENLLSFSIIKGQAEQQLLNCKRSENK
jgi:hypothetical protein